MEELERTINPAWSTDFERMTFPYYRDRLRRMSSNPALFAFAARLRSPEGSVPVALLLGGCPVGGSEAEIFSLYVDRGFRNRGVARSLLADAESYLAGRGVKDLRGYFAASLPARKALERTLAARGFRTPVPFTRLYRFDLEGKLAEAFKQEQYLRYRKPDLPRGFTFSPWKELPGEWREWISLMQNRPGWFEDWENPFKRPEPFDPEYSYLLWLDAEPVGWLVTHRLAADLLRYTHVFIRSDLRATGLAMALVIFSFWENRLRRGPRRCCFGIRLDNIALNSMVMKRFGAYVESISETLVTEKSLDLPG